MSMKKNLAITLGLVFFFVACSHSRETVRKSKGIIPDCVFGVKALSYLLFTRKHENGIEVGQRDSSMPLRSGRAVFVIHGFTAHANDSGMYELINALLKKEDINVFSVNWDNAACTNGLSITDTLSYGSAINNAVTVGQDIAEFSMNLALNHGVAINKTMLMGHSLGGHVAAFAGKHVQQMSGQNYSMIVGLDAAGPGFYFTSCDKRLCKTDAAHVIAMHTSIPVGLHAPIGHADFYFNGGNNQPDCLLSALCNHLKVVDYAINFVRNPKCYLGTRWQLDSWTVLSTDQCDGSNCAHAGLRAVREKAQGVYYVKTSSTAPYCNA